MSPVSSKICKLCGEGFRGTPIPEEVYCAKCFVKTCDVPDDTDEQFMKLVSEIHGPDLSSLPRQPLPSASYVPMIGDMLNHTKRLNVLEKDIEQSGKTTKEKNRVKREIQRLRKEKDVMDGIMEGIKAKMVHLALMTSVSSKTVTDSPSKPRPSPTVLKVPANTPASTPTASPFKLPKPRDTIPQSPFVTPVVTSTPSVPPRSPLKQAQTNTPSTPSSVKLGSESPVKRTALKFEAAAKRRTQSVSFANVSSPSKARSPEVNNNVTVASPSSSSEEDLFDESRENGHTGTGLTRSNSVRDRIKAFEAIQRSASTGSYDRRKYNGVSKGQRSLSTMKGINI